MKSVKQALSDLSELESKTHLYLQTVGYQTELASQKYKYLISLCTSLSTVFLHFSLYRSSLTILHKALKTDVKMFFEGDSQDRCWSGRILLYCNLSYLLLKCGDHRSSLKFLYDSESLLSEMRAIRKNIYDLRLAHAFLTFIALLQIKRYEQAQKYLSIAITAFAFVSERFDVVACKNIFILLEFSRIALAGKAEGKSVLVDEALGQIVNEENENEEAMGLIIKFQKSGLEDALELINADLFVESVFLTVFFPFVTQSTPVIPVEELKRYSAQQRVFNKLDISMIISGNRRHVEDNYSLLMKSALEQVKFRKNHI